MKDVRKRVATKGCLHGEKKILESGCQRKEGQNVKNVNGRGSTEYKVHTNIMHRSGEVMYKYTKHSFLILLLYWRYEHHFIRSPRTPFL